MTTFASPAAADHDAGPRPLLVLRPEGRLGLPNFGELWQFRDLLLGLAMRDVKLRYRQTALGVAWVILQPLLGAVIFSLVFGVIAGLKGPEQSNYFVFSYAGMLAWTAFSSTLTKASGSLVGNANLVSKVYFPRLILPLSTVLSSLIDFGIGLLVLAVMLLYFGVAPGWAVLLLPLWLLVLLAMALGAGLFASAMMVTYRDVQYVLPVTVQMLLYASPVGFPLAVAVEKIGGKLGPAATWLVRGNPLSAGLEGIRWSLLATPAPSFGLVAYAAVFAGLLLLGGMNYFAAVERRFADVI